MGNAREEFLETVARCRPVVASPGVAARWDEPSVLAEFTVRGLAGHLVRAATTVVEYLDEPAPEEEPIPAPAYFVARVTSSDIASALNVAVRERGEADASGGHAALVRRLDEAARRLAARLASEPEGRLVRVAGGLVMRLDDYLVTRVVELVVHADDLALSVGLETPVWPAAVADAAIGHLVAVARRRHGDLAVLRALTRRERDAAQALRVF